MGFFDDVDIESVNKKKSTVANKDEETDSLVADNLLDDLMPTDEEDTDDVVEDVEDDDMDDMFPEMPVEYDESEDDDDVENITEPIENEPVYETPKNQKPQIKSETKPEPLAKKDQDKKSREYTPVQTPKENALVKNNAMLNDANSHSNNRNVILEGTVILGSIQSAAPIDIYGQVDGSVESTEDILIGDSSSVNGSIKTQKNAVINGDVGSNIVANNVTISKCKVKGDITAQNINLVENSIIIGNISSSGNVIVHGAVKGDIDAKEKVEVSETAIIQGNIKSAIISIAPGAAIDGTCTQEYAKVKPADFFADIE